MERLLLVLDLVGTFVFAVSGATAGVRRRLDLFGVLVLSFAAANAGGMTRDVLIGSVPPAALTDWRYLAVSLLAGVVTFYRHAAIDRLRSPVLMFDAMGLAIFAVSEAQKALVHGQRMLGMLTAIGGGMARDVLSCWLRSRPCRAPASMPRRHWPVRRSWSSANCCGSRRSR